MPTPPPADVRRYLLQIFRDTLVHLHLLVHIEIGQPVIHHYDSADIVEHMAAPLGYFIPNLHRITLSCTVGKDGKLIISLQLRCLDELPDHIGRHVPVDGIDYTDFVRLKIILPVSHHLRNAQQFRTVVRQLAGDIEAVARSGEIKDDTLVLFPPARCQRE